MEITVIIIENKTTLMIIIKVDIHCMEMISIVEERERKQENKLLHFNLFHKKNLMPLMPQFNSKASQ